MGPLAGLAIPDLPSQGICTTIAYGVYGSAMTRQYSRLMLTDVFPGKAVEYIRQGHASGMIIRLMVLQALRMTCADKWV